MATTTIRTTKEQADWINERIQQQNSISATAPRQTHLSVIQEVIQAWGAQNDMELCPKCQLPAIANHKC